MGGAGILSQQPSAFETNKKSPLGSARRNMRESMHK
jgi:hypothetical protein